jgi:hypothetical protein
LKVPTVSELIKQIDTYDKGHPVVEGKKPLKDFKKTEMKGYVETFKAFLRPLQAAVQAEAKLKNLESQKLSF